MSDFFKSSASSSGSQQDVAVKIDQFKQKVRSELALQNAQELMNKMTDKCFVKCVTKPSLSLSSSEEKCLANCMQRYMEAYNVVSRAYSTRLSKERAASLAAQGNITTQTDTGFS